MFVTPNASVIGNVSIGDNSSIWYGARLLANEAPISIGSLVSIGDKVEVSNVKGGKTEIGDSVTVGHGAKLTSCTLQSNSSVEIASEVPEGCVVESFSVVAAGSRLAPNTRVPTGQIWAGSPAVKVRDLSAEEQQGIALSANQWYSLGQRHLINQNRSDEEKFQDHLEEDWAVYEETEEENRHRHRY